MSSQPEFTLLYDSECPMCRREVEWLLRRDRHGRLAAVDIMAPGFDASRYGLAADDVHRELCGVLPDGTITRGMESMRRAWRAAGLGALLAPTAWPGLRQLADLGYRVFARYRVPLGRLLGRRCDNGACAVTAGRPRRDP
ncbi:MAG: DUF393 domain-containing protein [Planctomycetes bacterium]|nr:DUF393 domain-containing protein [Planctomycetota bacterium]